MSFTQPIIATPERMIVDEQQADYLVCHFQAQDNLPLTKFIQHNVAKPYQLRHVADNYVGITSLTADEFDEVQMSDGSTTETVKVTPNYVVGKEIRVLRVRVSGVTVDGEDLDFMDANVDGKAWAVI